MRDLDRTISTYEEIADEYHERHSDREEVRELLEDFLNYVEGQRVLDVGCGPGWESSAFSERGYDIVGIDRTRSFLEIALEECPEGGFALMDMRELGFSDDSFDAVWSCASFLHIPRKEAPATLGEFRRVLRPGGSLFLSVKRGSGERRSEAYEDDTRKFVYYESEELRELLVDQGFEIEKVEGDDWLEITATA